MIRQMKLLTALESQNLFGWNVFRHTKDPRAKRRYLLLAGVWALLAAMIVFYVGALAWGLSVIGLAEIVPAYLIMIASLLVLAFGLFKAGQMLFSPKGYDQLCSLPIPTASIVASRFWQLYLSDAGLCLLIMVPGCAVVGWMNRPGAGFWLGGLAVTLLIPVLPLAVSALIGTVITAVSSRMKRKALAQIILSLALVVGVLALSFGMTAVPEENYSAEMLFSLADTIGGVIGQIYPPAVWLGNAMLNGGAGVIALYALGNLLLLALLVGAVARLFHPICRRLFVTSARHDYRMGALESRGLFKALWLREGKRYFASSVYVTNTIVGPVMGAMMAAALLIAGMESLEQAIPLPVDLRGLVPFVLAMPFTLMPTTCVAVSMEGKQYWIAQSLPISRKQLLDAKIALYLSLVLPFYVIAEILLTLALRPSPLDWLWQVLIPALLCVYAAVAGLAVNLRLGSTEWESEAYVVKQSASAGLGGFAGPLMAVVCGAAAALLPGHLIKLLIGLVLAASTYVLYRHNNKET